MWEFCNVTDRLSILKKARPAHPREIIQFLIHLVCLSILFLLPEVIASFGNHNRYHPLELSFYLKPILWVMVFYASFYFTTDPTSRKPHAIAKFIAEMLLILILAMVGLYFIWEYNIPHMGLSTGRCGATLPDSDILHSHPHPHPAFLTIPTLRDMVMVVLTISLAQSIKFVYKIHRIEQHRRDLMTQARETELRQLKAQLKPHFLFNTLNSIYALIDIDHAKAQRAIHKLSKMLRYMLYENDGQVTVAEETQFIRFYIDLMKMRLAPTMPLNVNIDTEALDNLPIAPLTFINVVENAFKYGSRAKVQGPIEISLTASGSRLICSTLNNYSPPSPGTRAGIGLANLRRRLDILYPNRYKLSTISGNGVFRATLLIDISAPPQTTPPDNTDSTPILNCQLNEFS